MKRKLLPARTRHSSGFTLIEVSVAAVISFMAISAVFSVFIAASKMTVESFHLNQASMQARIVIDNLTGDIRMATDVLDTFDSFTADDNTLILKLPAIDANGFPVDIDSKFDHIIYHQDEATNNALVREVIADGSSSRESTEQTIGTSEETGISLSGTYETLPDALGAFVIYYKFTAVQKNGSKNYEMPLAGSIRLRNRTPA